MKQDYTTENGTYKCVNYINETSMDSFVSGKPDFLVKWGNLIFIVFLGTIIVVSWMIKYPDVIDCNATLVSINAPRQVIAEERGQVIKIFCEENDQVKKNQLLAVIESNSDYQQILELESILNKFKHLENDYSNIYNQLSMEIDIASLGNLQSSYKDFLSELIEYKQYLKGGFYYKELTLLKQDLINLKKIEQQLLSEKLINDEDIKLHENNFDVQKTLKSEGVISEIDFRNEKSSFLNKSLTLPRIEISILNNKRQQEEKRLNMLSLQKNQDNLEAALTMSNQALVNQITIWKRKHLLVSQIQGKIRFSSIIEENQLLQQNDLFCYVVPENTLFFIEVLIPQSNLGKVERNQTVHIELDSYPREEYGIFEGSIEHIYSFPIDGQYLAKVILNDGLQTTKRIQITYRHGLSGKAQIITKNERLASRIFKKSTSFFE